jgi:hypothetical protein
LETFKTHQFLVCGDGSFWGENINNINKGKDTLFGADKVVNIAVNAEKTKEFIHDLSPEFRTKL